VRNRDPLFLLAAAFLHAIVVVFVWFTAPSPRTISENSPVAKQDERLEFDIERAPEPTEKRHEIAALPIPPAGASRLAARGRRPLIDKAPDEAPYAEAAPGVSAPLPAPESTEQWSATPASVPGLDDKPIWAVPDAFPAPSTLASAVTAGAPPVVPAAPANTGTLATVLAYAASGNPPKPSAKPEPIQHFPAAGTLASALASEIRGSSVSPESKGVFELVLNSNGQLVSVQVIASDPERRKEWERIAHVITQRFGEQKFPLPDAYAGGSRIRVAVTSQLTMPDGTAHGVPIPMPTIPGLPSEHDIPAPGLDDRYRGGGGKAGLPPTSLSLGLSFSFDLANIGARPRRVVHTRITAAPLVKATSQGAADSGL